jgi:hypothetical protein
LENGRAVGKTKRHNHLFKRPIASPEGGFPFVALCHPNKVESVAKVYLGVNASFLRSIK